MGWRHIKVITSPGTKLPSGAGGGCFGDFNAFINRRAELVLKAVRLLADGHQLNATEIYGGIDHAETRGTHDRPEPLSVIGKENDDMNTTTTFLIGEVQQLRELAGKARRVPREGSEGWSKSEVDPMELLSLFPSLHLKVCLVLREYQFRSHGNGNGIVWAMPEDMPFLETDKCPKLEGVFLEPPRPPGALDNFMDAIEGDGSPWSYLSASIFAREAAEFGAIWHGGSWSTHRIIGSDPWSATQRSDHQSSHEPSENPDNWHWLEPEPSEWMPEVCGAGDVVTVTFYTFSGLGREIIYRNIDTYKPGRYRFKSNGKAIAEGRRGYVF